MEHGTQTHRLTQQPDGTRRRYACADLEYGVLPADSEDCSVFIEVEIGIKGQEGSEIFSCTIVTPNKLAEKSKHFGVEVI